MRLKLGSSQLAPGKASDSSRAIRISKYVMQRNDLDGGRGVTYSFSRLKTPSGTALTMNMIGRQNHGV